MKKIWKQGAWVIVLVGALYILYLRECKRPLPCPPENQVLIAQSTWDSIKALADKPPVVIIDTQWVEKPVVTPDPQPPLPDPQPNPADTTINHYADSLINKEINVWVDYKIQGLLLDRKWRYRPITVEITKDSVIYVPKIVEIEKPVKTPQNGLYVYGLAGGNIDSFLFGGGADWITKRNTEIGYFYQRFGDVDFHNVKLGIKITFKR